MALCSTSVCAIPDVLPPFLRLPVRLLVFQLYRSKWRFASLPDLFNIFRASSVLALALLVIDYVLVSPHLFGFFFFGKITIALYWLFQMFFLGGPRIAFRYIKYARSRNVCSGMPHPDAVAGAWRRHRDVLRAIESGTVKKLHPQGVLSYRADDLGQSIRGVPVLGTFADLDQVVQDFQERGVRSAVSSPPRARCRRRPIPTC